MRVMMVSSFRHSRMMNHMLSLAAELNRQGIEAVAVISGCPDAYRDPLRRYQRLFPCFAENSAEEILRLLRYYRPEILHLHAFPPGELLLRLLRDRPVPWGLTSHDQTLPPGVAAALPEPSFIIKPHPAAAALPAALQSKACFIPEGIELELYRPLEKEGFKAAFILEQGNSDSEAGTALLKAAALADIEVELISPRPLPLLKGRYYGWPLECSDILARSQIVVARRRGLLEGMACGNAALIMGRGYGGIFTPQQQKASLPFPDLSGEAGEAPCYRSIFFDLTALLKEPPLLRSLQEQGRKFIRENCDLRLVAERTGRLYRRFAGAKR